MYITCVRRLPRYVCFPNPPNRNHKVHKEKFRGKSKNRVWVAGDSYGSGLLLASPFRGTLVGHEMKTRQGNKQWTANRQLQLAQQSLRKAALLSSARKASLVSMQRGKYMLDSSGKRLKRVGPTWVKTTPSLSSALTYRVNMEASVKRIRARYVCIYNIKE